MEDHEQPDGASMADRQQGIRVDRGRAAAEGAPRQPGQHQDADREDETVGRDGEQRPGFLHPPQVGQGDQDDEADGQLDLVRVERGDGGGDGEHAGHHRHRNGEDVVGEQRRGGHQSRERPEVVLAHDVGAAAARVGADRLPVGDHHHRHQRGDGDGDRHDQVGRHQAGPHQHHKDLLRGVGHRRERVRGEHRQSQDLRQERVLQLAAGEAAADQDPFDQIGGALRGGLPLGDGHERRF